MKNLILIIVAEIIMISNSVLINSCAPQCSKTLEVAGRSVTAFIHHLHIPPACCASKPAGCQQGMQVYWIARNLEAGVDTGEGGTALKESPGCASARKGKRGEEIQQAPPRD